MKTIIQLLAEELGCKEEYVNNVVTLLDEGNTIPFIARYRKEAHGAMDDTALRTLETRLQYLRNLQQRRDEVKSAVEAQGKLTDELARSIDNAATLAEVEDLYRPYKQKRRTRATVAKEKGLEPLADAIFAQDRNGKAPEELAKDFLNPDLGVETIEDALSGASDIIAERISDDAELRKSLRARMQKSALCESKAAKEDEDSVYRLYYDFHQPVSKLQSHQVLALNRGEKEGYLKVALDLDRMEAMQLIQRRVVKPGSPAMAFLAAAAEDSYERLLAPSMERELRTMLTDAANEAAIRNFALNLRPLLMQPPVKGFVTMGLDPGYAHGCKVAVIDATGKVLDTTVVYPTFSERKKQEAIDTLKRLIDKHGVKHLAIGNGTASRETEAMAVELIRKCPGVSYMIVNEAGASVYSASKLAAEEFPQFDVNLRSAVSIARRLQDPLAELVKIDPKAIGVGQYQHDMPAKRLDEALGGVVEACVNAVGVDLNTASPSLLENIAGISSAVAKNIVAYRQENGAFTTRTQIKKVPKLGPKAFEQCAGFLRVPESKNILDHTGVHPESYDAAGTLLTACGYDLKKAPEGGFKGLKEKAEKLGIAKLAVQCGVGEPTLKDIIAELEKPGRDPRDELPSPILRSDIKDMKDLKPGMEMRGTVRNVIDFGAFVDIGVHQDGLVHITQISDKFVRHPSDVLKVGDIVTVWVLAVDVARGRISLTMKKPKEQQN